MPGTNPDKDRPQKPIVTNPNPPIEPPAPVEPEPHPDPETTPEEP